ncbi:response regulator [Bacteriovoracaceae bacterium]|nr:response regulator [Bacteriovoracaceae bacterium]|tara:strand:- start:299941 stop:300342 length:402 start_codon:yes stop_codon:yes gene_type:complete
MSEKKERNSKLNIVVVDDSDFSRNSVVSILEDEGFNVVGQAASAEDGIALSGTTDANLFLIDVVMPQRSGIELAKILSEKSLGTHIIMMSSLNIQQVVIESISSGALDFLPKPFSKEDLLKSVEKIDQELSKE